jgi:hypothetical protein
MRAISANAQFHPLDEYNSQPLRGIVMPKADIQTNAAPAADMAEENVMVTPPSATSGEPQFDYDEFGVTLEDREVLENVRSFFVSVGRKRTEEIFECGEALAKVEARLPDQKAFDAWTRKACRITRRGAANYIGVFRNLAPYRERLVSQSVPGSAMYKLISADAPVIESVLSSYERGEPLTVQDISRLLSSGGDPALDEGELGGRDGLRRLIARKTVLGVADVMDITVDMMTIILDALERHRNGKRIVKEALSKELVGPARIVRQQIEWLTWIGTVSGDREKGNAHLSPSSRDDRWYRLWRLLYQMGGIESWPKAPKIVDWLVQDVLPELEWLLGGEADKARQKAERQEGKLETELPRTKLRRRAAEEAMTGGPYLTVQA